VRHDLLAAAWLGAAFLAVLVVAEAWARLLRPPPEWPRKLVHTGGGAVCLLFPFQMRSPWAVLALALPLALFFAWSGRRGLLRSLHGVKRKSHGSEAYPVAIFLLFVLAHDRPWLYVSAVLVLAVSDALAALVGSSYGVRRFEVEDETKSVEGSLVFLLVTFFAVQLPMLLMTDLPVATCLLAALLVSLLVTGFEIICLEGIDNLVVPLAVYVLLSRVAAKPVEEIASLCASLFVTTILIGIVIWRVRIFNVGGTVVFILFAYGAWTLGSFAWALPVLLAFAAYVGLRRLVAIPADHVLPRVRLLARIVVVPLGIVVLAHALERHQFLYGPYLAACAAILAFVLWNDLLKASGAIGARRAWGACAVGVLASSVVLVGASVLRAAPQSVACVAGTGIAAAMLNDALEGRAPSFRTDGQWSLRRWALSCAAGAGVALAQSLSLIPVWPER
jgi:dolichol kinase